MGMMNLSSPCAARACGLRLNINKLEAEQASVHLLKPNELAAHLAG
jgi:hypothetical protein